MALTTLDMLLFLAALPAIRGLFVEGSLPTHSAYICLQVLDRLVGARDVDITRCRDVRWKPQQLIADLVSLVLLLARLDGYVQARCSPPPVAPPPRIAALVA